MKITVALLLVALCGLVAAQRTIIDSFEVGQSGCRVSIDTATSCARSGTAPTTDIFGGERDLSIALDTQLGPECSDVRASSISISPNGVLNNDSEQDTGLLTLASDQSCAANAVAQYDGADDSPNRDFTNTFGGNNNFASFANSIRIRYASDIVGTFTIDFFSTSASERCSATVQTQAGDTILERNLALSAPTFTTGCNFNNIRVIELNFPALLNFDVSVSVLEFLSTATTGRVFVDCDCDGNFETGDVPLNQITVTLTPGTGCSASTRTTTTDNNGNYQFTGLPACTYTVAASVSQFQPCNGASRSVTTNPNTVVTATINYRQESSFIVPEDTQRPCNSPNTPPTGTATSGSTCGGSGTVTSTDTVVRGRCDGEYVINRLWTDGTNSGTQVITIVDTEVGPSISCPGPSVVDCDSSLKPAVTGRPTVFDDCTQDIDVLYTGTDEVGTCSGTTCTANTIVTRVFTPFDDCGNQGQSCTQIITITPCTTPPTCPNPANCHNASILYREGAQPVDT